MAELSDSRLNACEYACQLHHSRPYAINTQLLTSGTRFLHMFPLELSHVCFLTMLVVVISTRSVMFL